GASRNNNQVVANISADPATPTMMKTCPASANPRNQKMMLGVMDTMTPPPVRVGPRALPRGTLAHFTAPPGHATDPTEDVTAPKRVQNRYHSLMSGPAKPSREKPPQKRPQPQSATGRMPTLSTRLPTTRLPSI